MGKKRSKISFMKRFAIFLRDDFQCGLCGHYYYPARLKLGKKTLPLDHPVPEKFSRKTKQRPNTIFYSSILTIDHVTAVVNGGDNTYINLVTACQSCNKNKADKTWDQLKPAQQSRILDMLSRDANSCRKMLTSLQKICLTKYKTVRYINLAIQKWLKIDAKPTMLDYLKTKLEIEA